jgi:hypothetical protein
VAILVTEEDIASSFEDFQFNDLFFFFGSLSLQVQHILPRLPPQPSSQALSLTGLPGKSFSPSSRKEMIYVSYYG